MSALNELYDELIAFFASGLKALSVSSLNELYDELEHTFRDNSEVLITSLALRDEQEYEKELKNQFISLLLGVQKKRQMNKKRYASNKKQKSTTGAEPGTVSGVHVVQPWILRLLLLLAWATIYISALSPYC